MGTSKNLLCDPITALSGARLFTLHLNARNGFSMCSNNLIGQT